MFTCMLALSLCGIASAELRISGSIFRMDELDKAKEKAAKDEEPLIFVYTDPGSS